MAPNTALCFLLLAGGLLALRRWENAGRLACRAVAVLSGAIATARLVEYTTGLDLAVDLWFVRSRAETLGLAPIGRMAFFSALSIEFLSFSLALLSFRTQGRLASRGAAALALGVTFIGFTFTIAFCLVPPAQLAASGIVPVSLPTALCFVVLGAAVSWYSLLDEITDRRHMREQVRRERDLFERIMETSPTAIILADAEGQLRFANAQAESLLGLRRSEITARTYDAPAWDVRDFADRPMTAEELPFSQVKATQQAVVGAQLAIRGPAGGRIFCLVNAAPLSDEHGGFAGMVATVEDVSERLRVEEELRRAKEAAEFADHTKSAFLVGMSHEIRTPLNAIIGFAELLVDQRVGALSKKQTDYLGDILQSGRHLLELINDILDLSKVASGRMELHAVPVAVAPVIEAVAGNLRGLAQEKAIEVQVAWNVSLPAVLAEPGRFKQILLNLLSNAIKFTPPGGTVAIRGEVSMEPDEGSAGYLRISVTDSGVGLCQGDLERIFLEFERVEAGYSGTQQGTGLGLALSRRLVELHGGRLWAESAGEGTGTTFCFTLPLAHVALNSEVPPRNDNVNASQSPSSQPRIISRCFASPS